MYNLDDQKDFERFMLDYYLPIYPTGKWQVYNTHMEPDGNGGTVSVANPDTSWTDAELPILPALHSQYVLDQKTGKLITLYENNWYLYQHNYAPNGKPIQTIFTSEDTADQLAILEARVRDLEIKTQNG